MPDFKGIQILVNEHSAQLDEETELAKGKQAQPASAEKDKATAKQRTWLIERFVVGPENRVAHAVATSVTEKIEGWPEWPIVYLYGPCGVGKTHLLKGIAEIAYAKQCRQKLISAEALLNEFSASISEKTSESFRRKYRSLRLLLIDDADFLLNGNKIKFREELVFLIEAIIGNHGCVVFCANNTPQKTPSTNVKLNSLLVSGLTIEIKALGKKTLEEIIEYRAKRKKISLKKEEIEAIAARCSDVREALGILSGIRLLSSSYDRPVDSEILGEAWGHLSPKQDSPLTIRRIQEVVAKYFRIRPELLNGKSRTHTVSYPRQIAMYLCRKFFPDKPIKEIAIAFGRDYSTVIYACKQIEEGDLASPTDLKAIEELLIKA